MGFRQQEIEHAVASSRRVRSEHGRPEELAELMAKVEERGAVPVYVHRDDGGELAGFVAAAGREAGVDRATVDLALSQLAQCGVSTVGEFTQRSFEQRRDALGLPLWLCNAQLRPSSLQMCRVAASEQRDSVDAAGSGLRLPLEADDDAAGVVCALAVRLDDPTWADVHVLAVRHEGHPAGAASDCGGDGAGRRARVESISVLGKVDLFAGHTGASADDGVGAGAEGGGVARQPAVLSGGACVDATGGGVGAGSSAGRAEGDASPHEEHAPPYAPATEISKEWVLLEFTDFVVVPQQHEIDRANFPFATEKRAVPTISGVAPPPTATGMSVGRIFCKLKEHSALI